MGPTCKIPAQLLNLVKSYDLSKWSTYTVVKSQYTVVNSNRARSYDWRKQKMGQNKTAQ
jgi:hypothetical protein